MHLENSSLVSRGECDKCGSSDGNILYDDNHKFCFVCNNYTPPEGGAATIFEVRRPTRMTELIAGGEYIDLSGADPFINRGILKAVAETFGVKAIFSGTEVTQVVFPFRNDSGQIVAQKARKKGHEGKGIWYGDVREASTLFGQHLFTGGKKLVVTEGEYDCLAVYQMFGQKYPVVSIRNGVDKYGTKAMKEFSDNFDYFRNFEEIVLCFDNDDPGRLSAEKVAQLFPPNKCKIMKMNKHKDANEYLLAGDGAAFNKEFWDAKPLSPTGIVYGTDLRDRIIAKLKDRHSSTRVMYPWDGLNLMTYGIRSEEMVTIISGSGMGKSAVVGELAHHILTESDDKIGLMMLEESVEMANLRLASLSASKPFHLPDTKWSEAELGEHLARTVELTDADGNARVVSFDHFGSNGIEETLFRIDHMVALGCKYIFLDHISILVSDQANGDERRALDEIATKLRTKVQEHSITLFIVSHLRRTNTKPHEEGGQTSLADIRGTAAIGQLSDLVIGLERNGQAEDEIERNTTTLRILKNRFSGVSGEACKLFYNRETGRLTELPKEVKLNTEENKSSEKVDVSKAPVIAAVQDDDLPF